EVVPGVRAGQVAGARRAVGVLGPVREVARVGRVYPQRAGGGLPCRGALGRAAAGFRQQREGPGLLLVELLEEAFVAQVEAAPRPAVPRAAGAVVPAPARRAAGPRPLLVGGVILRPWLPPAPAAPERLLALQRH